ncbi:MAG: glycosyltransferase [Planctomycetes bacterium]|nr:glycosyltransferase [Planctomycetota bacterium]
MPTLSLVVVALNEEAGLPLALASARPYVDEVVVGVDRRTRDGTREAAGEARVVDLDFVDFSQMRNDALAHATAEWILMLDADETLEGDPRPLLALPPAIWELPRHHWLDFAKTRPAPDEASFPDWQGRLFPRDPKVRFERPVHEVVKGIRRKRTRDLVLHHFKYPLRSPELREDRAALYERLVAVGRAAGYRYR